MESEHNAIAYHNDRTGTWQAKCECGWTGTIRVHKHTADEDAQAHDAANNHQGGRRGLTG